MSSSDLDGQYEVFRTLLDVATPAEAVKKLQILQLPEEQIQQLRELHEQRMLQVREREEPRTVVHGNRDTWYTGPRDTDVAWPAVRRIQEENGWPEKAITDLDNASTRIVSLLSHPKEREFSTRGLVVGYVQSGKTTNFTSVMAKAADRGYKLFIVLAGIHNGLRKQTQARLVQQLVAPNPTRWSQLTGLDKDFVPPENAQSYFGDSNQTHVVCVVKKNATVLRKFEKWLRSASAYLQDAPALVIDDEADQATVATTSINPLIRNILDALPKSAYLGYTATPFANLLIDPSADDLYPKDFVVNLPKPEGHFGTEVLFGRYALDDEDPADLDDGYDMIRNIPDEDVHNVRPASRADIDGFAPTITETLREAVHYFWLTTAARRVRGKGNPHSTMLIHTSVNTQVHNSFQKPLENLRARMRECLDDPVTIDRLRTLWEHETKQVLAEEFGEAKVSFEELWSEFPAVLDDCRVIMDNSSSEDRLDYDNGPVVAIAVGGNTLSRGLTLEGLSVSYFVRAVSAYDTLLQMGRWFGFRNGYADLPRIWMTEELQRWFRHLATVETEMRRDIDVYMREDESPMSFAVRLRTHPSLRVTAAAKMRSAVHAASAYGGRRIQTRYFHTNAEWLQSNQEATRELVARSCREAKQRDDAPERGRYVLRGVPHEHVLRFLESYAFHSESQDCNAQLLSGYIEKRVRVGSLRQWNVAIVGNPSRDVDDDFEFAPGVRVGRVTRARMHSSVPDYADIKTLMSRADAAVDLEGVRRGLAEEDIKRERKRLLPHTGLIVLYPIDKHSAPAERRKHLREPLDAEDHVIGVGLVFPEPERTRDDSTVRWDGSYISADLSGVQIEEEDYSPVESEDMA
ncbi:Z1 domain-containing protein [Streptomyces sp. HNM0574]|uniref:Z1 domain-containing protein n=1 Tax=Streptomyces sp. HNM0574 TaxID=2714954 RepID=UPI00146D14D0|nr:Z1 domain-containing protein [Streptomyces sp. HNM0574]NLU68425.1 Z1 domain-containing protein [Streptomyces sp. HNM0574]